ncbi:MAG: sensor histidine kinase [Acidobacteria bacterium]|nr:MAG: sensor histidine kinase [Acidobacteriota bacterium]
MLTSAECDAGDAMTRHVKDLARALHVPEPRVDNENVHIDRSGAKVLAEVAHEMRQPLSAALAALHTIRISRNDRFREHAYIVLDRQFQRLSHLLDDLTEVSRISLHGKRLHTLRLDLRTAIDEACDAIEPLLTEKRLRLETDLPAEAVWVEADWARLQQILSNLLHNAAKFTDSGGLLRVALTRDDREAVLTVTDNGRGIPPDLLDKVFKPFTTGNGGSACGLGIGLAVVRQLVELHHGRVRAISPGTSGGTDFEIRLPLMLDRRRTSSH